MQPTEREARQWAAFERRVAFASGSADTERAVAQAQLDALRAKYPGWAPESDPVALALPGLAATITNRRVRGIPLPPSYDTVRASMERPNRLPERDGDALLVPTSAVPMSTVQARYPALPQHHVAWMASRLYEFVHELVRPGLMWGGLLPESMLVLVKEHGVLPFDPRFVLLVGATMRSAPASLAPLAPSAKVAGHGFDLACVNRTALVLLGDPTGTGNTLLRRTDIHPSFLRWFRSSPGTDPAQCYKAYRRLLETCFGPPKYHNLEM